MGLKGHLKNGLIALALASVIAPQAEALEIFGGASAVPHMNDDLITQVRGGRGGGGGMRHHGGGMHHGGMHRGGMHGGMHRPGGAYGMHRPDQPQH